MKSDSPSLLSMSRPGASTTFVSPDKEHIPRKIKKRNFSENLQKKIIKEPDNPIKRAIEDSIIAEKNKIKKHHHLKIR